MYDIIRRRRPRHNIVDSCCNCSRRKPHTRPRRSRVFFLYARNITSDNAYYIIITIIYYYYYYYYYTERRRRHMRVGRNAYFPFYSYKYYFGI